jgi:hypothetical protein
MTGTAIQSPPPQGGLDPDPRADEVLGLDELDQLPWQFPTPDAGRVAYRSARLWVQALRMREPERVRALERKLRAGSAWRAAWAEARRGLDVAPLVRSWASDEVLPGEEHRFSAPEVGSTERAMAAWEARCVRADLWLLGSTFEQQADRLARARAELESAAREAPGEALPLVALARLEPDPETSLAVAEATARTYPRQSGRGGVPGRHPPRRSPRASRTRRGHRPGRGAAPDDPDALSASAVEQARTGQVPVPCRPSAAP